MKVNNHDYQLNNLNRHLLSKSILLALCSFSSVITHAKDNLSNKESEIEIIEITAQKRIQNITKVPITVSSVNASLLEESVSIGLTDIDKFVPGFTFSNSNVTQATASIRGISSPNISVGGDPSSATFFDDVYLPRAAQNVLFSDIQRIEVLKGPQGTLFGRNAAIGVISIVPNHPEDSFLGFIKTTVGTDNLIRYEGMINIPVSDTFFVRANLLSNNQNGFIGNIARTPLNDGTRIFDSGEENHDAGRIAFRWEATEQTDLTLSFDFDDLNQAPPQSIGLSEFAFQGGTNPFASSVENDVRNGVESRDMFAVTAKLAHDISDLWSLKYVASYREWETVNREDEDGTADPRRYFDTANLEDSNIFYTELQINYVSDKINAVAGFSYSKEDVSQLTELNLTADTIARLTTGQLNSSFRDGIAAQLAATIGSDSDEATSAVFGPGVTFEQAVDTAFAQVGGPIDHIWNEDEWARLLNTLGFGAPIANTLGLPDSQLTANAILATGDLTYNLVSQQLGVAEIFGPSFGGIFWQESIENTGDFTNFGIYADIDYAINEKWHVIGGLRYSRDEKNFTWFIPTTTFAEQRLGVNNVLFPTADLAATDSWNRITGRLVTSYYLDENQTLFASFSTGYKSGGFDSLVPIDQSAGQEAFEPEDTTNIEIGYKGVLWDQLVTNISVYRTELDNFQVVVQSQQPETQQAVPTIINEDREITGIELDTRWRATDALQFGLITEIRSTDVDTPSFFNATGEIVQARSQSFDAATNYTLTLDWTPNVDFGVVNLHVDYVFLENINEQRPDIQAFQLAVPDFLTDREELDLRLSWESNNGSFEAGLWANNLLNERYVQEVNGITVATLGTPFARVNRGRELGLDFKYNF